MKNQILDSYIPPSLTPRMLDNFGITMDAKMAEAFPAYEAARQAVYASGILGRFKLFLIRKFCPMRWSEMRSWGKL